VPGLAKGDGAINSFRTRAFYLLIWHAWLVGLVALVLVVAHRSAFGAALLIAANMALIFAVALSIYAGWLTEERIPRTEAWRATTPSERPAGFAGLRWARNHLEELVLRFAKGASAAAIALSATALVLSAD